MFETIQLGNSDIVSFAEVSKCWHNRQAICLKLPFNIAQSMLNFSFCGLVT